MQSVLAAFAVLVVSMAALSAETVRGQYRHDPDYGIPEFQDYFTPCNATRSLDSAQLLGPEVLMSSIRVKARQYANRINMRNWDLVPPLYLEGTAVFEDSASTSGRYFRFSTISKISEAIPDDCLPWRKVDEKRLGDFLFPADDRLGSSPFRRATQAEIDALRRRADWPDTLEHCGANHPSSMFKAYDLSGDGLPEFVFSSPCGQEDPWNQIWVHHGGEFHFVGLYRDTFDASLTVEKVRSLCSLTEVGVVLPGRATPRFFASI